MTNLSATVASTMPALVNHLWQSTLFAAVAALLTLLLRKHQAQLRHRIWLAASLKFLVPFSLLTGMGSLLNHPFLLLHKHDAWTATARRLGEPFTFIVAPTSSTSISRFLPLLVAAVWLCGFAAVLTLWLARWRQVAMAKQSGSAMRQGREVELLRRLEAFTGVRKPTQLLLSQHSLEPGVIGVVRPALLWPALLSEHLTDPQLEAILAHELAHVRRRDNLAAVIQMAVEASCWFHPFVWIIGMRLVEERERACDEAVLEMGTQAQTYAKSILKTCQFCVGAPLACVSGVTGADLKNRMVRIMNFRSAQPVGLCSRLLLLTATGFAIAAPIFSGFIDQPRVQAFAPQMNSTSTPQADADSASSRKVYHIGEGVSAPQLIFAPDPQYSEAARQANYQGVCVVSTIVDEHGKPTKVQILRHLGMGLDEEAVRAVSGYRFKPARLQGKPVAVEVHIEVNFRTDTNRSSR